MTVVPWRTCGKTFFLSASSESSSIDVLVSIIRRRFWK
jgi:hypothetical protein